MAAVEQPPVVYAWGIRRDACPALPALDGFASANVAQNNPFFGYEWKEWGVFLRLAIVPTLFGHYLFNWLLKYMNAAAVSMSVLGEPIIASVLAWMLLGESLSASQLAAGVLILFGVWLFIRHGKEEEQ